MIQLDVRPGIVGAVFFIIFDVLILAILDVILAHVVCAIYYRQIQYGSPIDVKSADIPGITTYLLGKLFTITNIFALGLKIGFIVIVFFVNVDINNGRATSFFPETRTSTFHFNASDAEWASSINRTVERRFEKSRRCFNITGEQNEQIKYFRLAFNLTSGSPAVTNETQGDHGSIPIDEASIFCLNGSVKNPQPLVNVLGCSPFLTDRCRNGTIIELQADTTTTDLEFIVRFPDFPIPGTTMDYKILSFQDSGLKEAFPVYTDPKLYCTDICNGVEERQCCAPRTIGPCNPPKRPCVLRASINGNTLVERWNMIEQKGAIRTLQREFPGPVFEGNVDFGIAQLAHTLFDFSKSMDWRLFSGTLIANALIYRADLLQFERLETRVVTTMPIYAIALGASALAIAVIAQIIVHFTIGKDDRPRFNSIDGLSSIVREENSPSGSSYKTGATAVVGLSTRGISDVHFGPLQHRTESVARGTLKIT